MPDLSKVSTEELLALREKAQAAPSVKEIPTEQLIRMREEAVAAARPKVSSGESLARGAVQGATLGFSDEVVGAVEGGARALAGQGDFSVLYKKARDESRLKNQEAQLDNPGTYLGGQVAGGIGTALIPGVGIAKGATTLANIGKAAALGGAAGAGFSEASPTDSPESLKELGKDIAKGAAIGGVTQGVAGLAGKGLNALKPTELRKFANVKTVKAAGFMGGDMKKLGREGVQELGETLNQKGIVKAFDSLEDIGKKAAAGKEEAGQAIGKALESVDELVTSAKASVTSGKLGQGLPEKAKSALNDSIDKQFQFNMGRIADKIEKELISPNAKNPLLRGELGKLKAIADDFRSQGITTLREGNVIKGTQGKVTNFNSETVPQSFKKEVYGIIKGELDDLVSKTGTLEGALAKTEGNIIGKADVAGRNKSVLEAYTSAKKDYGALKRTAETAENRLGQLAANREISLTDTIAGAAGLATGGPAQAIAIGGLNKLARQYGDSVMASGARRAAEVIEKAPQLLGKFAGILESAAKKGAPSLNATHTALMKDPDYRAILDNFERTGAMRRRLKE